MPAAKTKDPKAEIENLVPGHEYKFRVSAVNNEGQSEPLEAEHSIIAKNPFGKLILDDRFAYTPNNSLALRLLKI